MKSTGVVRKIDELGRIVIPVEVRRSFGIDEKDPLEIYVDGEHIILKKYQPGCRCCGETEKLVDLFGTSICKECLDLYNKAAAKLKIK